jgi:dCTP deaminase
MSILSDKEIKDLCVLPRYRVFHTAAKSSIGERIPFYRDHNAAEIEAFKPMISPYSGTQVREENGNKILSWGSSSYGYDVRLADEFKIFSNINSTIIDPLDFDQKCLHDHKGPYVIIPPNSYVLGKTIEYFDIPRDIMVICVGKSTYARLGAIVNVTPIEPGFKGNIVIEISNSTSLPLKVYANMGISQFLFFKGIVPCEVSYADRGGKYMLQNNIQTALL